MPQHLKAGDDLEMMRKPDLWPQWPVLPVKRYGKDKKPGGWPEAGVMIEWQGHLTTVFLVNMWALKGVDLKTCPKIEYTSYNAILADGWVVD